MDVSSVLKQVLHGADPVEAGSKVERSGVASLRVTTVDIVWCAMTLNGRREDVSKNQRGKNLIDGLICAATPLYVAMVTRIRAEP